MFAPARVLLTGSSGVGTLSCCITLLTIMPLARKSAPVPLPQNPDGNGNEWWKAYNQCLFLEKYEEWGLFSAELQKRISNTSLEDLSPRVTARVLGRALLLAPSENARNCLVHEIVDCNGDLEMLAGLAHLYVYGLIRVFYNPKGPTPSITPTQSPRYSFQHAARNAEHLLQESSITSQDLRQLTLFRDHHCCVFTGAMDIVSEEAGQAPAPSPGQTMRVETTKVAHIISQSLSYGIDGTTTPVRKKLEWAKTAGAIIERFGDFSTREILGDNILNSPANAFTASTTPHVIFDQLELWLTPTIDEQRVIIPNTYDVNYSSGNGRLPYIGIGVNPQITFRSFPVGNEMIPPPHPRLIALHAACAQIAHMSGAAEHLKEFFRDTDMVSVMTDPNAASELTRALKTLQVVSTMG